MRNIVKGFSIAEAMVMLLIVSIAMAAMAPIFSKKTAENKSSTNAVPPGAIMYFDNTYKSIGGCPSGWSKLDNSFNDRYIKISDNAVVYEQSRVIIPDHFHGVGAFSSPAAFNDGRFIIRAWADNKPYALRGLDGDGGGYQSPFSAINAGADPNAGLATSDSIVKSGDNGFAQPQSVTMIACRKD